MSGAAALLEHSCDDRVVSRWRHHRVPGGLPVPTAQGPRRRLTGTPEMHTP
jgi:hypothetical protein